MSAAMHIPVVLDPRLAQQAKDEGMAHAAVGAGEDWLKRAVAVIRRVAETNETFTSDTCWALGVLDAPSDARAFGVAMKRAAQAGICARTDRVVPSARKSLHASPRAVWRSLVFRGIA